MKNFTQQIEQSSIMTPEQRMIVNGQLMVIPGQVQTVLCCPKCKRIFINLQKEVPAYHIHEELSAFDMTQLPSYCDKCGQALDWNIAEIFDAEIIEVRDEPWEN